MYRRDSALCYVISRSGAPCKDRVNGRCFVLGICQDRVYMIAFILTQTGCERVANDEGSPPLALADMP